MIWAGASFVGKHWRYFAMGVLLLALAFAWNSRNSWKEDSHRWQQTAGAWRKAFDSQKSAYQAAQAAARAKAEAQRVKDESRYQMLAERADNVDQEMANLRRAAGSYARLNSVRRTGAAKGDSGRTGATGAGSAAEGGDGTGDTTEVAVSRADFDTLVEHSIRLKQVHDWGESLVAAGLATKAE